MRYRLSSADREWCRKLGMLRPLRFLELREGELEQHRSMVAGSHPQATDSEIHARAVARIAGLRRAESKFEDTEYLRIIVALLILLCLLATAADVVLWASFYGR